MESIYDRYGGQSFWDRIMDEFYLKNCGDLSLRCFFEGKDLNRIKRMNNELLACALRPNADHFPLSVKRCHKNLQIFGTNFTRFVENLKTTLDENSVRDNDSDEILTIIESFRVDLVKD